MSLSARNWAWDVCRFTRHGDFVRDVKPGEKLTLLCIAESENPEYGYAFPSMEHIAERTGQSVRTVKTHVKTLADNNAFTIERRRSPKGRWDHNVYVLKVPESYREKDPAWQQWN